MTVLPVNLEVPYGSFFNSEWKKEWGEVAPETGTRYADGTWAMDDNGDFAVYDGATNLRGFIRKDGTMEVNARNDYSGVVTAMDMTFLRTCLATLKVTE